MKKEPKRNAVVFVDNFFYHRSGNVVNVEIVPHLGLMTLATLLEEAVQATLDMVRKIGGDPVEVPAA